LCIVTGDLGWAVGQATINSCRFLGRSRAGKRGGQESLESQARRTRKGGCGTNMDSHSSLCTVVVFFEALCSFIANDCMQECRLDSIFS
jgi:hypothetical protein